MKPKVSIIISTRNRIKLLLERSLPSALEQTYRDFEVIVIDDASDDDTYHTIKNLNHPRITCLGNFKRRGLAGNKNLGIDYAKGEYIVFLDDDNKFHPDFLKETVKAIETPTVTRNYVDAVMVRKTIIYPEGKVSHLPKLPCSINDGFLMRKQIFKEIKFDEELQANEDSAFGIVFFKEEFEMGLIDKNLMTVYGSAVVNNTSYSDYTDYHLDGLAKFWLKHHQYEEYIGRMFMLRSGKRWFRWMYWLETKLKRYIQIWLSRRHL